MEKKNYSKFFIVLILGMFVINAFVFLKLNGPSTPQKVIENLYDAIDIAKQKGDYNCCIEPACTMCYLGHWKFEKGTCACDDAIAEGRFDDVCPECQSGIEEGLCTSTKEEGCVLDSVIFGGEE